MGALVGAAAGHAVDRLRGSDEDASDKTRQTAFTIAVIALSAKMAKADGQVTPDEVEAFRQILHVPEEELKNVGRVFDVARKDARGFEPYAKQVAKMFIDRPAVLEELLDALFHIAKADRVIHPQEEEFLRQVAMIFGFDEAKFARIRAGHLGADASDPFAILGVVHDADDAAVRTACMIAFIIAGASFLTSAMGFTQVPMKLAQAIGEMGLSPTMLLIALTLLLLIMGCFLDGISLILLVTAIIMPVVSAAGFDLIWFGIYLVIVVEMSQITPPVGFNLFVIQGLTGKDILTITKATLPFFLLMLLAIALMHLFPSIALYLPYAMTS